jgi:hypothetical protein
MQTKFFRLDILTPIHIGTGEEADPMSYLMRKEGGTAACHIINTNAWAADYPDPDELSAAFSGANIPQMRSFLAGKIDPDIYGFRRIQVSNDAIFQEYESKLKSQQTSNQLLISPQMSSNGRTPIIPGSSLKGALRTAVIDWLDRELRLGLKQDPRGYEEKLKSSLGHITDNAFKQLKIGDVEGWSDSTELVEAREVRRKEGKESTPKNKCEVLPGYLQGESAASALFGKLSIGALIPAQSDRLTLPGGKSWSWDELAVLVNSYLLPRLDAEISKFYCQPHFAKMRPVVEKLRQALVEAAPGQMFLRVGHYSQVEFVTVRDNQPLTRKGKDGTFLPHGTTRTLANGLFPFGWVRLTPCKEEEYRQGNAQREGANLAAAQRRIVRREEIAQLKLQTLAKKQEEIRQKQETEKAAERRQAELDALAPVDRQLLLLSQGELNENDVVALFTSLPQLEGAEQLKAATAIRDLWSRDPKKWSKKECSNKQWEKVQQLKKMLGEG